MNDDAPYRLQVFHDYDFYYAYVSGIKDKSVLRTIIEEPMSQDYLEMLDKSIQDQKGLSLEKLRSASAPVVFSARGQGWCGQPAFHGLPSQVSIVVLLDPAARVLAEQVLRIAGFLCYSPS